MIYLPSIIYHQSPKITQQGREVVAVGLMWNDEITLKGNT
jgi:hypothetical protein